MSVTRIASRYAKSLMDFSTEKGNTEAVLQDMKYVKEASKVRDLKMLLNSPIISLDKKKGVFDAIFKDKISETSNVFLHIILKKGRERYIPNIAAAFEEQYKKQNKITSVNITTAAALDEEAMDRLQKELLGSSVTDKSLDIEMNVDPSIIGGYILKIGDKLYNASVAHQLEKLKKEFSGNQYEKSF